MTKLDKHQIYFKLFFVLSVLGAIDIATRDYMYSKIGQGDAGVISFYFGILFAPISVRLSATVITILSVIFDLSIICIGLCIVEYSKIKKMQKKKE